MRMLIIHVDYFKTEMTEKSRSKLIEEPEQRAIAVGEALAILTSVEKSDEVDPSSVAQNVIHEITKVAGQLKAKTIVLHSFAHLFAELSSPGFAIEMLKSLQKELELKGYRVYRTPFGWFNTLELKAKGHPLSRIARIISAGSVEK